MSHKHAATVNDQQEVLQKLGEIRGSIDNLDAAMIHILAERFRHTQEVGRLKADHDLPPSDPDREKRQVARLRELARESRLDPEFAEKFLNFVIAEVIHHHRRIAEGDDVTSATEASAAEASAAETTGK